LEELLMKKMDYMAVVEKVIAHIKEGREAQRA
jgi:hypothetical protein